MVGVQHPSLSDTFDDKKGHPGCLVDRLGLLTIILLVIVSVHLRCCAYLPPFCARITCD